MIVGSQVGRLARHRRAPGALLALLALITIHFGLWAPDWRGASSSAGGTVAVQVASQPNVLPLTLGPVAAASRCSALPPGHSHPLAPGTSHACRSLSARPAKLLAGRGGLVGCLLVLLWLVAACPPPARRRAGALAAVPAGTPLLSRLCVCRT
ncbi:hypothetical protein ABT294_10790 [Nonomuraea sp. NPDC000554]|uniref:hypothetical protein n=1 Tax=Nonomuraea sp. NPDC000554 TaxID=3154259 RepID=UPI003333AA4E